MQYVITCILLFCNYFLSIHSSNHVYSPEIYTNSGPVIGILKSYNKGDIYWFLGIPYAEPPIENLRLVKPKPISSWTKVLKATKLPKECYQPRISIQDIRRKISEDCLYLSIAVPKAAFDERRKFPVLIMLDSYGHQFTTGSGSDKVASGYHLILKHNIIIVTLNYRLNFFGFAYSKRFPEIEANLGLWDQNMAMRWVNKNIYHFYGDPNSITIHGQGAGGIAVYLHILSPFAKGLFVNAISESPLNELFKEDDESLNPEMRTSISTEIVIERLGCDEVDDALKCLQEVDAEKIINSEPRREWPFMYITATQYLPQLNEDAFLKGNLNDVNLLTGFNSDDGSIPLAIMRPQIFANQNLTYYDAMKVLSLIFKPSAISRISDFYFESEEGEILSSKKIQRGLIDLFTDITGVCTTASIVKRILGRHKKGRIYYYQLNHIPNSNVHLLCKANSELGVCLKDEIPFVTGSVFVSSQFHDYSDDDRKFSEMIMSLWSNFIHHG